MATHDPYDVLVGDTWEQTGPLQDASGKPLNLTGATITWKLTSLDGLTTLITLTLGSGVGVLDSVNSIIVVKVPSSTTVTIPKGVYKDWLRVVLSDGTQFTEWTGVIRVSNAPA